MTHGPHCPRRIREVPSSVICTATNHRRHQVLLPAKQNPRCYPIAAGHRATARARLRGLLDNPALVLLAECPSVTITCRWDNRSPTADR